MCTGAVPGVCAGPSTLICGVCLRALFSFDWLPAPELVNDQSGAMEDSRGLSEVPLPIELGMGLCSGWWGRELG